MTNPDSTELQTNQAVYAKLPTDEGGNQGEKHDNLRVNVEVKLNDDKTKESNTDSDTEKQEDHVGNGQHKESKLSVNGGAVKKLDEDEDDDFSSDGSEDSFMFGMSKLRTFFFFLSLSLLVAFVLIFVFVLPCSETAQMEDRTTHISDTAYPGLTSKVGDMDADGKDDLVYFKPTPVTEDASRKRRDDAESSELPQEEDTKNLCLVDTKFQPCVGTIVIVSSQSGAPIGSRAVALTPEVTRKGNPIKCASGGQRAKMSCAISSAGNTYILDMKTPNPKAQSNMTRLLNEECDEFDLVAVSTKKVGDPYGFFQVCNGGTQINFVRGKTFEKKSLTLDASLKLLDYTTVDHQRKIVTLSADDANSSLVFQTLKVVATQEEKPVFSLEKEDETKIPVDDVNSGWKLASSANSLFAYSKDLIVLLDTEATVKLGGNFKSAAVKVSEPSVLLADVCSESSGSCSFEMFNLDQVATGEELTKVSSVQFNTAQSNLPVHYISGDTFAYFTAWHFEDLTPKPVETPANESAESGSDVKNTEEENASEETPADNSVADRKRRETFSESVVCTTPKLKATLLGFSSLAFAKPTPIFKETLCGDSYLSFAGLSGWESGEPVYALAVNKQANASVLSITLPPLKVLARGEVLSPKLAWMPKSSE